MPIVEGHAQFGLLSCGLIGTIDGFFRLLLCRLCLENELSTPRAVMASIRYSAARAVLSLLFIMAFITPSTSAATFMEIALLFFPLPAGLPCLS